MTVRSLLGCLLVTLGLALPMQALARAGRRFPCTWNYALHDGLRADYVTAGDNAICTARGGTLTLSTRLEEWDATAHRWRTARFRHQTWTSLGVLRYTEVATRCDGGRYRARFTWLLRHANALAGHLALTVGPITAPIGCRITLK